MDRLERKILLDFKYGNKQAFEYLFKSYYKPLCNYAFQILKNQVHAEEVVENLFVKLWENKSKTDVQQSFKAYLYRSTYNSCMNHLRKQKNEQKYREFFQHHLNPDMLHSEAGEPYPLSSIIEKELEKEMSVIIESLPDQCRKIFKMSRFDAKSHEEIAGEMNITINTVKTQIVRALNKIREKINFSEK